MLVCVCVCPSQFCIVKTGVKHGCRVVSFIHTQWTVLKWRVLVHFLITVATTPHFVQQFHIVVKYLEKTKGCTERGIVCTATEIYVLKKYLYYIKYIYIYKDIYIYTCTGCMRHDCTIIVSHCKCAAVILLSFTCAHAGTLLARIHGPSVDCMSLLYCGYIFLFFTFNKARQTVFLPIFALNVISREMNGVHWSVYGVPLDGARNGRVLLIVVIGRAALFVGCLPSLLNVLFSCGVVQIVFHCWTGLDMLRFTSVLKLFFFFF